MALYNVHDDKQLLFLHIPKTAGTSVLHWLDSKFEKAGLGYNKHIHKDLDYMNKFVTKPCKSFTIIRNPWDRIVSAYAFLSPNFGKILGTFDEFVVKLKNPDFTLREPRLFRSQTDLISQPVDYILKFENLSEDFKIIQEYLGCHDSLPVLNTTEHPRYQDYYTEKTKKIIQEIHYEDIEKFNYKFDD